MKTVRFGVVGVSGMGGGHCRSIVKAASEEFRLTAVADIDAEAARRVGQECSARPFEGPLAMFQSGLCDAVIVATPHYWHPVLTIQAARSGLHVLCEKPLGVTVGPARAMIAECKARKVALGAMLQQRTRPVMRKMKQIVDSGKLGGIFRVSMICSNWYRSQYYYDSGDWRGTWDGEGGGILLNQAPHSLDLFQWIGGMPRQIIAALDTRLHKIEVENTANAICLYGGGKNGYIYATTAEAPGMEQLMVAGDNATLIAEGNSLRMGRLARPISADIAASKQRMKAPQCVWEQVEVPRAPSGHIEVIRAFARHVLGGSDMVASGEEAINELEISNAVYVAGFKHKTADLPVDAAEIDRLLARMEREHSTGRGGGLRAKAARAMARLLAKK